uniref:Uncharacterized protein n=1 Tax=Salix viminalis TaxID=40686 RepID=A0A6N2JWK8_SALVM
MAQSMVNQDSNWAAPTTLSISYSGQLHFAIVIGSLNVFEKQKEHSFMLLYGIASLVKTDCCESGLRSLRGKYCHGVISRFSLGKNFPSWSKPSVPVDEGTAEDWTVAGVCEDIAKDFVSKIIYFAFGYKKIEPWMRNFPQALGPLKVEETKVLSWFFCTFVSKKAKGVVLRSQGNGGLRGEFKGEDLGWLSQPIFSFKNPYEDCLLKPSNTDAKLKRKVTRKKDFTNLCTFSQQLPPQSHLFHHRQTCLEIYLTYHVKESFPYISTASADRGKKKNSANGDDRLREALKDSSTPSLLFFVLKPKFPANGQVLKDSLHCKPGQSMSHKLGKVHCTSEEMNCPAFEENILLSKLVFNLSGQLFPFILLQFVLKQ